MPRQISSVGEMMMKRMRRMVLGYKIYDLPDVNRIKDTRCEEEEGGEQKSKMQLKLDSIAVPLFSNTNNSETSKLA